MTKNTYLPHKNIHKKSWQSPNQYTSNQNDHILVDGRHALSIMAVSICRGADHNSDHQFDQVKYQQR